MHYFTTESDVLSEHRSVPHYVYSTAMATPLLDMNNGGDLHHDAILNKNVPGDFTSIF